MITFYDLAGKDSIRTWSPNLWKTRYVLNLKRLPYRTVFVQINDIVRVCKENGIPHLMVKPDGTPHYTVPAIVDDATGAAISDSYKIAEYLDKQYPDTPKAFPDGTEALQAALYRQLNDKIYPFSGLLLVPSVPGILNDECSEYYHKTRAVMFGKPVDQVKPVGAELEKTWEEIMTQLDLLESWYGKSSGTFLVGDQVSFADFVVASLFQGFKIICGEESEEWSKIKTSNNGQWIKLLNDLEKYAAVDL